MYNNGLYACHGIVMAHPFYRLWKTAIFKKKYSITGILLLGAIKDVFFSVKIVQTFSSNFNNTKTSWIEVQVGSQTFLCNCIMIGWKRLERHIERKVLFQTYNELNSQCILGASSCPLKRIAVEKLKLIKSASVHATAAIGDQDFLIYNCPCLSA